MNKPLTFAQTMLASAVGVVLVSVIGCILMFVTMIGMVAAIGSMDEESQIVVKDGTFVSVDLDKISGDRTQSGLMRGFGSGTTIGLVDAIGAIRSAADDSRVKGLVVKDNGALEVSWASLEELRGAIADFRKSGKPVVSYATAYSQPGYYLSSVADRVYLHPAGMVDFRGMGAEVMYYKDLLDKLGVEMQLIRPESCSYKSAGEVYTLNHMSPANREQIRAYIASIWQTATRDIAESRGLTVGHLSDVADNLSGYMADDALRSKIVDSLCFEEDVRRVLKEQYGGKRLLSIGKYATGARKTPAKVKDAIAVIYAEGNVVDGSAKGITDAVYGDDIVKALAKAASDDEVKAIVLRVNSPGGAATASESMTHAVIAARQKKPLVVSMGDLAASAGYEMSCMADVIVAQPMTITGSIGVFGTVPSIQKMLNQKLGLHTDTVLTNSNAGSLSITRPLSPVAMQLMTRNVEDFYKTFVSRVAEGRKMTYDEVHKIARGRVWTGTDALSIGLVDTLGGLDLAIGIAAERAGVSDYKVKDYPEEKDTWTQLKEFFGDGDADGDISLMAKMRLARQWKSLGKSAKAVSRFERDLQYVSQSEGLQARLPFVIVAE